MIVREVGCVILPDNPPQVPRGRGKILIDRSNKGWVLEGSTGFLRKEFSALTKKNHWKGWSFGFNEKGLKSRERVVKLRAKEG